MKDRHPLAPYPEAQFAQLDEIITRLAGFDGTNADVLRDVASRLKDLAEAIRRLDSRAFPAQPNSMQLITDAHTTALIGKAPMTTLTVLRTAWQEYWAR